MQKISELFLLVPVWENTKSYKHKGSSIKSYTYKQDTKANLVYGSVIRNRHHKGDFIIIEPPFAFLIFESGT